MFKITTLDEISRKSKASLKF